MGIRTPELKTFAPMPPIKPAKPKHCCKDCTNYDLCDSYVFAATETHISEGRDADNCKYFKASIMTPSEFAAKMAELHKASFEATERAHEDAKTKKSI